MYNHTQQKSENDMTARQAAHSIKQYINVCRVRTLPKVAIEEAINSVIHGRSPRAIADLLNEAAGARL